MPARLAAVFLLMLLPSVSAAYAAAKIPYGSRIGMQVTVKSSAGLNTSHATIQAEHTRDDAIKYCRDYVGTVTDGCIAEELATSLRDEIHADCPNGTFTNFFGDEIQYKGRKRRGEDGENYVLIDHGLREIAGDFSGSDYDVNMKIFRALCPRFAPAHP